MTETASNPYATPNNPAEGGLTDDARYAPKVFAFSGRIGRLRYLAYAFLYNLVFGSLLGILAAVALPALQDESAAALGAVAMSLLGLGYLAMLVMLIVLGCRRLNDLNQSGWWLLLYLVPVVNFIFLLYMMLWPGSKGVNRFGAKPQKNSVLIILASLLLPVMVGGVLAAVAIPAYQDYVVRAQQAQ